MPIRSGRPPRRFGPPLFRRPFPGLRPLALGPRQLLRNAHRLFEAGRFAEAAPVFSQLAAGAKELGLPVAPRLYLQAARALLQARQIPQGIASFRSALDLVAAAGGLAAWQPVLDRFLDDLGAQGCAREAEELRASLRQTTGWEVATTSAPVESKPVSLPTHCPQCGGALRSDEVDWIDDRTAACAYCGSPVKGD